MTQDAYWDELGTAWTAINPKLIAPRLEARLRRQTLWLALAFFAGLPLSVAGVALGAWTVWQGASLQAWFFVTRGIAIMTISLLAGFAAWSFKQALHDHLNSLAAMIDLALLRAERWRQAIRLGYGILGVALVLGTAGYQIRILQAKPSATPLWPAIVLLAALAMVLFLLHRKTKDDIAKYRYLKQLLLDDRH